MITPGNLALSGKLGLRVTRQPGTLRKSLVIQAWKFRQFVRYGWREVPLRLYLLILPLLKLFVPGLNCVHSKVRLQKFTQHGEVWDYGWHYHLVVTAGKNYLAACMDNTSEPELLKFHGFGTGVTAAAAGDTALQTEMTTAYATDNTRPTGSQAHSTNTYTTVGTTTPDASTAVTEWGLLTQAATGGGTLLDHQVFSAITLNGTGDSLQATYVLTFS